MDPETSKAIIACAIAVPSSVALAVAGLVTNRLLSGRRQNGKEKAEVEVYGERLVRIETTTESLKETAVAVGQALITHDAKDERVAGELRTEMKEGFKGVYQKIEGVTQKIDALTGSVMQALGNKP